MSKATKKAAKKKTTESSDPPEDEESDAEVEFDSLGSFFVHLIDNDYSQDDAEASHADHVEVILLSSDAHSIRLTRIIRPLPIRLAVHQPLSCLLSKSLLGKYIIP